MSPGQGDRERRAAALLKMMLGMFCAMTLMGFAGLIVLGFMTGSGGGHIGMAMVAAVIGGAAGLLYARDPWSLAELRTVEVVVFGTVAVYLATLTYDAMAGGLAPEAPGTAPWSPTLLPFALLALAYGLFAVPNPPRRAIPSVLAIGLAPAVVVLLVWARHPELRAIEVQAPDFLFDMSMLMATSTIIAMLTSFIINKLFSTAYESRRATFYDLEEFIDSGGMGEVWRARHRALARPAAVKLIRQDRISGVDADTARRVLLRFEQEAMATARLRSPHTIAVFDAGITADGHFYYAMEYLDGLDLAKLVDRFGPVPAERTIHFLIQACDSLADAHDHGLTHRDIKPANINVSNRGPQHDHIKLLDFGIVKTEAADERTADLTVEGAATGTPAYMAPEMAVQGNVDGRADVYALGCVAYWLLTGRQVFEAESHVGLIVEHVTTPPIPPSERTEVAIPPELEEIVMKCLEKDPDNRFQSARDLAEALTAVPVSRPWTAQRAEEWWDRHFASVAAA